MGIFDDLLKDEAVSASASSSGISTTAVVDSNASVADTSKPRILGDAPIASTTSASTRSATKKKTDEDDDLAALLLVPTSPSLPVEKKVPEVVTTKKMPAIQEPEIISESSEILILDDTPITTEHTTETTAEPSVPISTENNDEILGAFADLFATDTKSETTPILETLETATPIESNGPELASFTPAAQEEAPAVIETPIIDTRLVDPRNENRARGSVGTREVSPVETASLSNIWDEEERIGDKRKAMVSVSETSEDPSDIIREAIDRLRGMLGNKQTHRDSLMQQVVDINEHIGRLKSEAKTLAQKAREIATEEEKIQKTVVLFESQVKQA